MIRFLHAADLHLDAPFRALSPEQAAQSRQELRRLPAILMELAEKQHCDIVLLAGDLLDTVGCYPETVQALVRAFAESSAEIFIAPGNHDFFAPASPYATQSWPAHVHIFSSSETTGVFLPQHDCWVYGAAFQKETAESLLTGFRVSDPDALNLMVLHGDPCNVGSPYGYLPEAEIAQSGLDYLALGHIHQRSEAKKAGKTTYAWPGCPMGRGFDETGEKGVYLGTVDHNACTLQFLPVPGRRYEILSVQAGDDPAASIETALAGIDTTLDAYRILLTGEADEPDLGLLQTRFAPRFYSLSIQDHTTPKEALWQGAGEDTLRGFLLEELHTAYDAADETEKRVYELAARYARTALEGREAPEL